MAAPTQPNAHSLLSRVSCFSSRACKNILSTVTTKNHWQQGMRQWRAFSGDHVHNSTYTDQNQKWNVKCGAKKKSKVLLWKEAIIKSNVPKETNWIPTRIILLTTINKTSLVLSFSLSLAPTHAHTHTEQSDGGSHRRYETERDEKNKLRCVFASAIF